jgi:hypothetical protein
MAFCTSCGAPVEGAFCTKCGTHVGAPGASSAQAEQSVPPIPPLYQPPAVASAPKRHSPLFWILGGCLGLIVIGGIIAISTGVFIAHKAGLDPALMKQNPGLAVAKMMATMNPDVEVLAVDEDRGIIRVREKKTGKTMTINLKDAQNGRIVFQDDQNQSVEIQSRGEGENASVEVRSSEGTMRMGASSAGQLPDWLPSYPGAESAGTFAISAENGKSGSCAFKTGDSVENVASFYEGALKDAGFVVQKTTTRISGKGSFIMLMAEDSNSQRNAHVTVVNSEEGTTINLVFETKK